MRTRPIRAFFYQKTVVFGVRLGDWRWIGGAMLIALLSCLLFKLNIRGFPLAVPLPIFTCVATLSLFNWVRVKRKPLWLEHNLSTYWRAFRYRNDHIRPLNTGETPRQTDWLIDWDGQDL